MNYIAEDILMHYGVSKLDGAPGPGSGRYPLGSGENPNQHNGDFLSRYEELKKTMSERELAEYFGTTTTKLRAQVSLAKSERRASQVVLARHLREDKKMTLKEIADYMGFENDSSVRTLLNESSERRMKQAEVTANYLKEICDKKGMIDVGKGVELELGISREKLRQSLEILKQQGYEVYGGGIPQPTNKGQQTNVQVLCPPGTPHKNIYDFDKLYSVKDYDKILTDDGTKVREAFKYPESLDSKRLQIVYDEQGGTLKDGLIELRRGVEDLSLGNSHYAQVRILVDGTHYLKGMAVYADDLPPGIDVRFNTNKREGTPILGPKDNTVLKPIKNDPKNPFGSLIKEHGGQSYYIGPDGKEHLRLINKRGDEGDWGEWADNLPAQFLSKQPMALINSQLKLAIADKKAEYDSICALTNPTIRKKMLLSFAESCDSAAVHLQAAALPRQKYQVILPLTSVGDKEIFAPNYRDGEQVALIRYPHGGTFEIPILTVNNKNKEGRKIISENARDAVGISKSVADRLSGADFDGDTVMVIPVGNRVKILSTPPLKGLEGFDAKIEYGPGSTDKPYKKMKNTQNEMGRITNLITDMTLSGATDDELARAVRHSMVVIDAEKHELDYKRSEKDNGISALKRKYQGTYDENGRYHEGAGTLISRAKAEVSVDKRQGRPTINEDGTLSYKTSDKLYYTDKKGKLVKRTEPSTQMAETNDARTLISKYNTRQEQAYAAYANEMKALANQSRKLYISTKEIPYDPNANKVYKKEVESINSKIILSELNAPRERQALAIANAEVQAKVQSNPDLATNKKELKKVNQQALTSARAKVGASRKSIEFTPKELEAIQAGAITKTNLNRAIKYVKDDKLKEYFTPRNRSNEVSDAKKARIKALKDSHYTNAQIAEMIGVSASTVSKYV